MKKFKLLTAAALIAVSVLTFTGCSQKEDTKTNTQVEEKKTAEAKEEKMDMSKKTASIAEGSKDMIHTIEEMLEKLEAKDEAGAIKEGSMIEEHWAAFEDAVKAKDKALYGKVEGPLDTINAALKVKPLDTKILTKEAKELVEILEQVEKLEAGKAEAKKELTIAEGAANMREAIKEMKEKLNAKNDAEAIEEGSKLEENWAVFEDAVKTKNKGLYEKVEGPLDTIGAGLKIKPLDAKILTNSANELDKVLAEVEKLK